MLASIRLKFEKNIHFNIAKRSLGRTSIASASLARDILHAGDRRGLGGASLQNGSHALDILGQALRLVLIFLGRHFPFILFSFFFLASFLVEYSSLLRFS